MPHYADGTEAKVGDHVTGKLYNTDGIKAGTIISITPGAESCNAMVQFTQVAPAVGPGTVRGEDVPRMARRDAEGKAIMRTIRGEQHGSAGSEFVVFECADYSETKQLTKIT